MKVMAKSIYQTINSVGRFTPQRSNLIGRKLQSSASRFKLQGAPGGNVYNLVYQHGS